MKKAFGAACVWSIYNNNRYKYRGESISGHDTDRSAFIR